MCVLPAPASDKLLEERERPFDEWSARLRKWCLGRKREGEGKATRELRAFFLCAQDTSLAECGPKGQGYEVSRPPCRGNQFNKQRFDGIFLFFVQHTTATAGYVCLSIAFFQLQHFFSLEQCEHPFTLSIVHVPVLGDFISKKRRMGFSGRFILGSFQGVW